MDCFDGVDISVRADECLFIYCLHYLPLCVSIVDIIVVVNVTKSSHHEGNAVTPMRGGYSIFQTSSSSSSYCWLFVVNVDNK